MSREWHGERMAGLWPGPRVLGVDCSLRGGMRQNPHEYAVPAPATWCVHKMLVVQTTDAASAI